MSKVTRTFTRDELEDLDVPDGDAVIYSEEVDSKRWATVHHAVFRAEDDGELWRVTYYKEGNELSEVDTWGYGSSPETIEAVRVEPYQVEVTKYRPVEHATGGLVDPSKIHIVGETGPENVGIQLPDAVEGCICLNEATPDGDGWKYERLHDEACVPHNAKSGPTDEV